VLSGLGSQWATLISELPVHARDFLLGLGDRLRRAASHFHIGLIYLPAILDRVPAGPGRLAQ
jgi:hypothetical protein